MARFSEIGTAIIPGKGTRLRLLQRNDEFSIRVAGSQGELMNSRLHGSEDALATLACERLDTGAPKVLIGGLGMGFTLAAALGCVGEAGRVTVAELVSEVVDWNHGPLGAASGYPLKDARARVYQGDVCDLLRDSTQRWDAILLDVDNGPEGLTRQENNWLYSTAGIAAAQNALTEDGVLAYWSASLDPGFTDRLRRSGLSVDPVTVRALRPGKGARHVVWLAW